MRYVTEAIGNPKVKRAIELAVGPLLLFALWWIAFKGQLVNKDLLPSPVDTLRDTAVSIAAGKMTGDFVHTIVRVGYSILIAVVAGVLSNIFSSRTLGLTGELAADAQPDYLSGLLIGHEIAALKNLHPTTPAIVLIGDAGLCRRYRLALDLYGLGPAVEAEGATEAGLWNLAQHAGLLA